MNEALFGCPDIILLTDKFLIARNIFKIFTEKKYCTGGPEKI